SSPPPSPDKKLLPSQTDSTRESGATRSWSAATGWRRRCAPYMRSAAWGSDEEQSWRLRPQLASFLSGFCRNYTQIGGFHIGRPTVSLCAWHCSSGPALTRGFFAIGRLSPARMTPWMLGRAACEHWAGNGGKASRHSDLLIMPSPESGRRFASHLRCRSIRRETDVHSARHS